MWNRYTLKVLKYTCPPILVAAVIFYLCCLKTSDDLPDISWPYADKVVHFLMYFGLSGVASFWYIYGEKGRVIVLKLVAFAFVLPLLYGGFIEIIQEYYFGRSGDWLDLLADALGSLSVLPLALIYRRKLLIKQFL